MGKLPKSMQKKKKKAKELRTKGTAAIQGKTHTPAVSQNRQMRRRLQQQGIGDMEQIEATRVIIQTETEDLIVESPQVIRVNQQGVNVYQVIGSAESHPSGSFTSSESESFTDDGEMEDNGDDEPIEEMMVEITDQDIQLVAMQTNVSPEVAEQALKESNGDLAKAIISLKTR